MTNEITLTLPAARGMLLAVQGLLTAPQQSASKADVLQTIRQMGVLQIDTIHVVARSPYLVLFSRLGHYDPHWLEELLAEGALFEYWAHAACFLPIEDYHLFRQRMDTLQRQYDKEHWNEQHSAAIALVFERIQQQGAVRSADFERSDGKKGGWWDWKEEKHVLEYLHTTGTLMIARREKFQRIYDLRERILPGWDDTPAMSIELVRDILVERSVRLLGAAPARWVPDYYRLPKQGLAARLEKLTDQQRLLRVQMTGSSEPWYIHSDNRALAEDALAGKQPATLTTLLSPFDPLVWDRERALTLFGFDYRIECYTPQAKRRYGYFSLPILHCGQLVGRLDAKAHRKAGRFEVKAIHLEPWVDPTPELAQAVSSAIQRCADWHATPQVEIIKSEPTAFGGLLRAAL